MRITVDISEENLKELLEVTGERKMSPAVARAVDEFIKRHKAAKLGQQIKQGDFELKSE